MTKINHYKLYKHKKQWVIGCSSVLLPLLMGITVAHADETAPTLVNQQIQPVQVNQPAITNTSGHPANEQLNSTVLPAKTAPTATTESTASSPAQAVQPNVTDDQHSSSHHPADWSHNYERVIWITYRDHYDTNGGASSNYHREEIIQMAENGHWEEVNWYPPEGTFPPGVKVPPVHFAAASPTESANQRWNVEYFMRSVDIQTATGRQTISQVYTIHNSQTVNIPEIEIPNSSIPAGYHPRISPLAIQNDKVIERGGHYYLTGATLTFDNIGVVYHGAGGTTAPGTITFAEKVILSAPINLVYQDLSGKVYNAYGDQYPAYAASYQDVAQVDYGQTLSANQLYADAQKYLNQYVTSVFDEPDSNYQIYGYFDPAGKLHPIQSPADYPGFTDAQAGSDGLTYQLAIVYRRHGKVDDPVTKTRTIIVNMPDGRQEKTIQEVTLAQFADYDGITGEELSTYLEGSDR
ncbi:KxYKxGKxW signal peptide domain-containing protein [Limosilactobacillus oris]|uniref:KxYKxGKxW signal peptide domain-containing protein n=1 Tax=Limosilactobacillus oris TaxID=1632 RepID=UPI003AAD26D0